MTQFSSFFEVWAASEREIKQVKKEMAETKEINRMRA
jgi:hypothetical protein